MLNKIWKFMNGKKVVVGAILTLISLLPQVAALLPVFGVEPQVAIGIAGGLTTLIGLLHKAYKFIYKEEHP
jgi:hypothetical protein